MGPGDQDVAYATAPTRTVDLATFWMDDTEITNNEYRQFVYWVRDSLARQMLARDPAFANYMIDKERKGNPIVPPIIDWNRKIRWLDPKYTAALDSMYYQGDDRILGKKEIDPRELNYIYNWVDLQQAARLQNAYNFTSQSYQGTVIDLTGKVVPITNRSSFVMSEVVNVYPDTLVWICLLYTSDAADE